MIQVAIINHSTGIGAPEVQKIAAALQIQVDRDFGPLWGVQALVTFYPTAAVPPNFWQLVLLDNADQAGALGYHDMTKAGLPLGKVFVKTTLQDGGKVSITASHELLEMLGDPYINLVAQNGNALYAFEACDACEDDAFGYLIGDVLVSDFVLKEWFTAGLKVPKYDFKGHITRALQLIHGGYIGMMKLNGEGWTQITAGMEEATVKKARGHVGSRRERRRTPRELWLKSNL